MASQGYGKSSAAGSRGSPTLAKVSYGIRFGRHFDAKVSRRSGGEPERLEVLLEEGEAQITEAAPRIRHQVLSGAGSARRSTRSLGAGDRVRLHRKIAEGSTASPGRARRAPVGAGYHYSGCARADVDAAIELCTRTPSTPIDNSAYEEAARSTTGGGLSRERPAG